MAGHLVTNRFTDALLDPFRQTGDPDADQVVATLFASGQQDDVNRFWHELRRADATLPSDLPEPVAAFQERAMRPPPWADPVQMRLGAEVFARHGPAIVTGLLCSSLPHAYSCAKGAEVLLRTGRMTEDLHRRIDETAQMVFDVSDPHGFEAPDPELPTPRPHGRALQTLPKVRLIHAAVRHLVLRRGPWDVARLGVPINAEDLAGTMLTFSWSTARAVEQLGADLGADEWEAWLHLWRVAGHFLGVPDALMPRDKGETEGLWAAIMRRQQAPSAAGRELTAALVAHVNGHLPGRFWDGTTSELMRTFLGDPVADWLGVPQRNWTRALLRAERWWYGRADEAADDSVLLAAVSGFFNQALLRVVAYADRGGRSVRFTLPESLEEQATHRWPRRR